MADFGVFETMFGLFPLSNLETTLVGLEVLEQLTDQFSPHLQARLIVRMGGVTNLLSVIRVNAGRTRENFIVCIPLVLLNASTIAK